ncbi:heme-binding protein 2 isoform X1 [Nothobranchius furzeri]|uniref:heme-binding protein 2 isoform X1 n=1 Tax=Nothobranchius furzeri TaxID=105023 RepID=UPI002404413E|nr:heme-binding protein 2 isoform X1 [Nothobranchius furzeri]
MQLYLSALVGFLLVLPADALVGNCSQLNFNTETEQCLLFGLVCKGNYEVRHYDSAKWVTTNDTSFSIETMMTQSFKRLYGYITGENDQGKEIAMTTPVVIKSPEKYFWHRAVYTMSFLLPAEHQKNPPKPTNKDVYIQETPEMNVYVMTYGGWMMSITDTYNSCKLASSLDSAKAKYNRDSHYSVGYNSPMILRERHNEVWYVAEGELVCPSQ